MTENSKLSTLDLLDFAILNHLRENSRAEKELADKN